MRLPPERQTRPWDASWIKRENLKLTNISRPSRGRCKKERIEKPIGGVLGPFLSWERRTLSPARHPSRDTALTSSIARISKTESRSLESSAQKWLHNN